MSADEEATVAELKARVEQLEEKIEQRPAVSRRSVLAAGGGLAALLFGSATASAGSNQVGTIGTSSNRVDLFAEDIDVSSTAELTGVSTSTTGAIGQGNQNYYSLLEKLAAPDDGNKYYAWHTETDATTRSTNDGDVTALYTAAKTNNQDVWAFNPLVEIEDDGGGYAGSNSYAIEADVNTDVDAVGTGLLLSGVGSADANNGIAIERSDTSQWYIGAYTKDVRDAHYRALDPSNNIVFEIQPGGNVNFADNDAFDLNSIKGTSGNDFFIFIGGNQALVMRSGGGFDFYNQSGTKTANLDSNGNLTLNGSLTENGSP
jgi:hypothetical protein